MAGRSCSVALQNTPGTLFGYNDPLVACSAVVASHNGPVQGGNAPFLRSYLPLLACRKALLNDNAVFQTCYKALLSSNEVIKTKTSTQQPDKEALQLNNAVLLPNNDALQPNNGSLPAAL